jgi:hypothetical protein
VTVRRPYRQLTPEAVRQVMARAGDRAGLDRQGAHWLQHALATEMLRAGASLPEVGQVPRHRGKTSSLGYEPYDERLRRLGQSLADAVTSADATDHGAPGRLCLTPFQRVRFTNWFT